MSHDICMELRDISRRERASGISGCCLDAANEIESLRAENEEQAREIERLRGALISIEEYWNRDCNDTVMRDACYHAIETASTALAAKGGSMTRMWQDVEGTIPATEPGQRVARVDSDGETMIQREAGKRPVVGSEIDRLIAENERLRDWIRDEGLRSNTCTFRMLRRVCDNCECHRKPKAALAAKGE